MLRKDCVFAYVYFRETLLFDPDIDSGWDNLAYLYTFTGREKDAEDILAEVKYKRNRTPYYHLNLDG